MQKCKLYAPAYFWHSLFGKTPDFETYLTGFQTLATELGITAAELGAFSFDWDDTFEREKDRMLAIFGGIGLTLVNYRIMSPDVVALNSTIREAALVRAEKAFQNAVAFGIPNVQVDTLSPLQIYAYDKGISPDMQEIPADFDPVAIRDNVVESLRQLSQYAEQYDVDLLIEPRSLGVISTPESAIALIREINSPKLKVVFDTAHMVSQNIPLSIAWATLRPYTKLVHLADNRPLDMRHAPVGSGSVQWNTLLTALNGLPEKLYLAIELLTFPADCLNAYRESIRRLTQTVAKYELTELIELPPIEE